MWKKKYTREYFECGIAQIEIQKHLLKIIIIRTDWLLRILVLKTMAFTQYRLQTAWAIQ